FYAIQLPQRIRADLRGNHLKGLTRNGVQRPVKLSVMLMVERLNPMIQGWGNFYAHMDVYRSMSNRFLAKLFHTSIFEIPPIHVT
ncbi:group II intron maturase-specific domain-containing protein, partial [Paenibacillus sp. TAF58]